MTNPQYHYEAKCVDEITVRKFAFEFPDDLDPLWIPGRRIRSLWMNGISLTMPYLEPFLVRTMREAAEHVDSPELLADLRGFNGQEAAHYKCHRQLNERLKANGCPELAEVEAEIAAAYERLGQRSLRTRLAYSAGFECMTNGFTHWFITRRVALFGHADPAVTSFWLMHMIEEAEHKTVAYDAYMACYGGWLPRAIGVLHGSFGVIGQAYRGLFRVLRRDGDLHRQPGALWAVCRETLGMVWHVGPFMVRALLPGFNPRQDRDPDWMFDWIRGHGTLPDGAQIPLVDTHDPKMPVPFPS